STSDAAVAPPPAAEEIDPSTGFSRTTVVRPLREFPAQEPRAPAREAIPADARPHIALILPALSPTLGPVAEAVRLGFIAAGQAAGRRGPPVNSTPTAAG